MNELKEPAKPHSKGRQECISTRADACDLCYEIARLRQEDL